MREKRKKEKREVRSRADRALSRAGPEIPGLRDKGIFLPVKEWEFAAILIYNEFSKFLLIRQLEDSGESKHCK
jgi:hypothetical protein